MRCSTCDESLPTTETPFGALCVGCIELDAAPLHPDVEAKLRLEMSDERAEEFKEERPCRQ